MTIELNDKQMLDVLESLRTNITVENDKRANEIEATFYFIASQAESQIKGSIAPIDLTA